MAEAQINQWSDDQQQDIPNFRRMMVRESWLLLISATFFGSVAGAAVSLIDWILR